MANFRRKQKPKVSSATETAVSVGVKNPYGFTRKYKVFSVPQKSLIFAGFHIIKDDLSDNKFLDAAVAGKANFIISGDKHLLQLEEFRGIKIQTPREFLEHI